MTELFASPQVAPKDVPLSVRMRPVSLEDFVGQKHILGEGKPLRRMIEKDRLSSLIFYGPPGCGKTALAMLIARLTRHPFSHLNAVTATVADLREVIVQARHRRETTGRGTLLFLDEIAHFNKLQQDALMQDVEEGNLVLIGATTHNPYFSVNSPLLSRALILQFHPVSEEDCRSLIVRALSDADRGLGMMKMRISEEAAVHLAKMCGGDCRRLLNALETVSVMVSADAEGTVMIDLSLVEEALQQKQVVYDRGEDEHYDTISAFIKSMRGSDPDAALYWLAKMLSAGEDIRFVARRIMICAAEDVGNAEPMALVVATSAAQAVESVGMPEARIILAQAVIYIATAPKSNAAYIAIGKALAEVEKERTQKVPAHLQSTGYRGAEKLGRGIGYLYPHDYPDHFVPQQYMPVKKKFYTPSDSGYERKIAFFLNHLTRLARDYEQRSAGGKPGGEKGAD